MNFWIRFHCQQQCRRVDHKKTWKKRGIQRLHLCIGRFWLLAWNTSTRTIWNGFMGVKNHWNLILEGFLSYFSYSQVVQLLMYFRIKFKTNSFFFEFTVQFPVFLYDCSWLQLYSRIPNCLFLSEICSKWLLHFIQINV